MKLKLMMLGMSLGALLLSGCNLLNLMGKPSLTSEQYKLLENMCSESKKMQQELMIYMVINKLPQRRVILDWQNMLTVHTQRMSLLIPIIIMWYLRSVQRMTVGNNLMKDN